MSGPGSPSADPKPDDLFGSMDLTPGPGVNPLGTHDLASEEPTSPNRLIEPAASGPPQVATLQSMEAILGEDHGSPDPWFAGVLSVLHHRRTTGILGVHAHEMSIRLYLESGMPVFAEGGAGHDDGKEAGGGLERARLEETRRRIIECFRPSDPAYSLEASARIDPPHRVAPLHPARLLFDGVRETYDPLRVDTVLWPPGARVARSERCDEIVELLGLKDAERRMVSLIDGRRTLAQIQQSSPLDPIVAGHLLVSLLLSRAIATAVDAEEEAPRRAERWSAAPPDPAEPRAEPLRKTSAREARPSGAPPGRAVSGQDVPAREEPKASSSAAGRTPLPSLKRAPSLLRNLPKSAAPVEEAKTLLDRAKRLVDQGRAAAARDDLAKAAALAPDDNEISLYLAYADLKLARTQAEHDKRADIVRDWAARVVKENRSHAKAYTILGVLALRDGDLESATQHLEKALELSPKDVEATRELRLAKMRTEKTKRSKGWFKLR